MVPCHSSMSHDVYGKKKKLLKPTFHSVSHIQHVQDDQNIRKSVNSGKLQTQAVL